MNNHQPLSSHEPINSPEPANSRRLANNLKPAKQYFCALLACAVLMACTPTTREPSDGFAQAMLNYRQHIGSQQHWARVLVQLGKPNSVAQGYQLQQRYVELRSRSEPRAGYKIALGSSSSQALLGASEPITGILFASDLLPTGSRVSKQHGMVLAVEADLLATVGSTDINTASSIKEVAKYIESLHAYIELPDLPFPFASDVAPRFAATNAGAHLGIVGSTVRASSSAEFINQLGRMQVVLTASSQGGDTKEISRAAGSSLMTHPYQAVLFLLQKLASRGQLLKKGDVISLGAYSKPIPVKKLMGGGELAVQLSYQGLLDHKTGSSASAAVYFH